MSWIRVRSAQFLAVCLSAAVVTAFAQDDSKPKSKPGAKSKAAAKNSQSAEEGDNAKSEDENGFGSARKKTGRDKVGVDDKEREKLRKAISGKLPKKEKSVFVLRTIERSTTPSTASADRKTGKKSAAGSPTGEKVDFLCIAGREAAIEALVDFMHQSKDESPPAKKSRSAKKGADQDDPMPSHSARTHRSWNLVRQFDDSKEREAAALCERLKAEQEMIDRRLQDRLRSQHGANGGFGNPG